MSSAIIKRRRKEKGSNMENRGAPEAAGQRPLTIARIVVAFFLIFTISASANAGSFDWRNYNGGDYTTPVRNQGGCGSCWAFGAVAALESKVEITAANPELNPDASEQHLICEGSLGDCNGGWEYKAVEYFYNTGVVTEQELPYTASNDSDDWPLSSGWENRVYKIDNYDNFINSNTNTVKQALENDGPLVAAILTNDDWYWPSPSTATQTQAPDYYDGSSSLADDAPLGDINHCVCVVGYQDDEELTSGGYWIVKNSWGAGWGDDGYGYVEYGVLEGHHRIHAITGDAYLVPEPATLALISCGGILVLLRRRRGPA